MTKPDDYRIHLEQRFGYSTLIDVQQVIDECDEQWFNQSLCQVNDCVVRLGIVKGEFHWHRHDEEDELFYVVEGRLLLDLEGGETIALGPRQGWVVPKGVVHRTRAEERTVMLMVEKATVSPVGDGPGAERRTP